MFIALRALSKIFGHGPKTVGRMSGIVDRRRCRRKMLSPSETSHAKTVVRILYTYVTDTKLTWAMFKKMNKEKDHFRNSYYLPFFVVNRHVSGNKKKKTSLQYPKYTDMFSYAYCSMASAVAAVATVVASFRRQRRGRRRRRPRRRRLAAIKRPQTCDTGTKSPPPKRPDNKSEPGIYLCGARFRCGTVLRREETGETCRSAAPPSGPWNDHAPGRRIGGRGGWRCPAEWPCRVRCAFVCICIHCLRIRTRIPAGSWRPERGRSARVWRREENVNEKKYTTTAEVLLPLGLVCRCHGHFYRSSLRKDNVIYVRQAYAGHNACARFYFGFFVFKMFNKRTRDTNSYQPRI